jgi:hypothetical protein
MSLKQTNLAALKQNKPSAIYYILVGKNGNENRYDLLGNYRGGYFSYYANFIADKHGNFLYVDETTLGISGGKRFTRRKK